MPILKVENEELFVRDAILLQQAMVVDETGLPPWSWNGLQKQVLGRHATHLTEYISSRKS